MAKRSIQDSGIYEEDLFGPGVDQLAKEAQEKAEAEEQARLAAESEKANQASSEEAKGE